MEWGWLDIDYLGLIEHLDITVWNGYLSTLKAIHVRLSNEDDKLVCILSKSGRYTPKEGYVHLLDRWVSAKS